MNEWVQAVREFNGAYGVPIDGPLTADAVYRRLTVFREEARETEDALVRLLFALASGREPTVEEKVAVLDGAVDAVYTAVGIPVELGWDMDEAFTRVHRANLAKRWPDGTIRRNDAGKIVKPEGFKPPVLDDLVR